MVGVLYGFFWVFVGVFFWGVYIYIYIEDSLGVPVVCGLLLLGIRAA